MSETAAGIAVVLPEHVKDVLKRPFFELAVGFELPSANEFRRVTRRQLYSYHAKAHNALYEAFRALEIPLQNVVRRKGEGKQTKFQVAYRLPKEMVFPGRATVQPIIYRTDNRETDPQNYIFPLDKLIIDKLTEARGNKWRAFGLLVDDTARWLYLLPPRIEYNSPQPCVILHMYAYALPAWLTKEK